MNIIKKLTIAEIERIQKIYRNYALPFFPQILNVDKSSMDSSITFEWIDGNTAMAKDLPSAFYALGKQHLLNRLQDHKFGFDTIIHGDFHKNNIIVAEKRVRFIDVTYIKQGWNYQDFDYVDFFNIYDPAVYPWMIHNQDCLAAYHDAVELKISAQEEENIKKKIVIEALQFSIRNGKGNNINTSLEENALKSLL